MAITAIQDPASTLGRELRLPDRRVKGAQRAAILNAPDSGLLIGHGNMLLALVRKDLAEDTGEGWVRLTPAGHFYRNWLLNRSKCPRPARGLGPDSVKAIVGADPDNLHRMPPCPRATLEVLYLGRLAQQREGYEGQSFLTEEGVRTRMMLLSVRDRHERRHKLASIAEEYEVCTRTVHRWLKAMGVQDQRVKLSDEQRQAICKGYQRGASLRMLAFSYGVSTVAIRGTLKARRIPTRAPGSGRATSPANRQETRHS